MEGEVGGGQVRVFGGTAGRERNKSVREKYRVYVKKKLREKRRKPRE